MELKILLEGFEFGVSGGWGVKLKILLEEGFGFCVGGGWGGELKIPLEVFSMIGLLGVWNSEEDGCCGWGCGWCCSDEEVCIESNCWEAIDDV